MKDRQKCGQPLFKNFSLNVFFFDFEFKIYIEIARVFEVKDERVIIHSLYIKQPHLQGLELLDQIQLSR